MEDFNFDDDVFTASSERKIIPLITDYQAKEETDGVRLLQMTQKRLRFLIGCYIVVSRSRGSSTTDA